MSGNLFWLCFDSSYLAATVLIRPDSELFILCANTLKKAFLSKNKVGCSG